MSVKKTAASKPKPKAKPAPSRLQNLAARPASFDEALDDQLVDHSGVFRVTTAIVQGQVGHEEDAPPRFASDSLVMRAQQDDFGDPAPPPEPAEERIVEDLATRAEKRARLATLTARAQARGKPRR